MTLSLKNVFLAENIMSQHYGLDKDTPRNVYVPDTTQNKVIAHVDEDPMYEDNIADVQKQLNQGEWEKRPGEDKYEIDWGDFEPQGAKRPPQQRDESVFQDEDLHTEHGGGCGCGEPAGPHLHRVGAPGGPNLSNTPPVTTDGDMGTVVDDGDDPRHVLYDTDVDPYEEGGVFGTGGPSKEGSVILQDHEAQDAARAKLGAEREAMWAQEAEDERREREEEQSGRYDQYASDWKGRKGVVEQSFGDVAGDNWLEIG